MTVRSNDGYPLLSTDETAFAILSCRLRVQITAATNPCGCGAAAGASLLFTLGSSAASDTLELLNSGQTGIRPKPAARVKESGLGDRVIPEQFGPVRARARLRTPGPFRGHGPAMEPTFAWGGRALESAAAASGGEIAEQAEGEPGGVVEVEARFGDAARARSHGRSKVRV